MGWVECRVARRIEWAAPTLVSLVLDRVVPEFAPGQFVNIALEDEGARVKRAYSLANAPSAPAEFYLVAVDDGRLSGRLARLPAGAPLWLDPRPHGFFTLAEVPTTEVLWLFATGTGLGPFVSMLRHGEIFTRHEKVLLVHSVREVEHLGYRRELEALEATRASFRYLPTVTRGPSPSTLTGRVTDLVSSGALEAQASQRLDPGRTHVLLCGNPSMLDGLSRLLSDRGLVRHRRRAPGHVTSEAYW